MKGADSGQEWQKETSPNLVKLLAFSNVEKAQRKVCPRFHSQSMAEVGLVVRRARARSLP